MKIKYFSWIKDITKKDSEEIDNKKINDLNELKLFLIKKYPQLDSHLMKEDILRIAINLKYETKNKKIHSNDSIAIFPPVSGG
jgi:MoaD family protein